MTSQVITQLARLAEINPPGVRRARFSLHFTTPRMRRWLLVQLVSVPSEQAPEAQRRWLPRPAPDRSDSSQIYNRLLDEYQKHHLLRHI